MSPTHPHRAFFLVGPTATGKTAVAQRLAEQRHAEILSADSMLVYRGMDIGTAKPTLAERNGIRYWGVDVVAPPDSFNVARFLEEARRCFESATASGNPVIVVGGTGLYIKALLEGLDELPDEGRKKWQALFEREGVEGRRYALERKAPDWLAALPDQSNSRRLIRALELVEAGRQTPPRSWKGRGTTAVPTGLAMAREVLVARIEARVKAMYDRGLLGEVQSLLDRGWDPLGSAAQAIGYAEAIACLGGTLTRAEAMRLTAQRTRQLAKRQMTWFRHQANVSWVPVEASLSLDEIVAKVSADWNRHGPQAVMV